MTPETPESSGDGDQGYHHHHQVTPTPSQGSTGNQDANLPRGDDSYLKVTRGHSCVLCQQRKVRCDKSKPCSNCVKAGVECRVVPPQPPRRRKKRIPERDLVDRLRRYESLLAQNGIEFDSLGPDVKITDAGTVEEGDELDADFIRPRASESPAEFDPSLISSPGETQHVPKTFKWFPQKSFRDQEEILRDSSDEDDGGSSINHAYDKMFNDNQSFPFSIGGGNYPVTDQHPSAMHIFQLWQIYLNNVNPLLKLTHTPTLQVRVIEASANLDRISPSLEALMFAIYLVAIMSMQDDECLATFNEEKKELYARYFQATQQALLNAGFMRTPSLTLLQAYLLYCIGARPYTDPRFLFCLTGIGVRLAHRMGLHRDGAQFNFSPFEVEERRRLWWSLAGFDRRIGEMTGSTITAISNGGDCKLPLNINDADLHLNAKDPPTPHTGPTEMLFALPRLEFCKAPGNDKMRAPLSDSNPQAVPHIADHRLGNFLERYCTYLEDTYLKYCDHKIPIHYFTLLCTRMQVCKLKVMSGFFRIAASSNPMRSVNVTPLSPAENDMMFVDAIKMIEYDSMIHAEESLKGFYWYTAMWFPFPAYVCLLNGLRTRTTGELCERAWDTICEHHERRKLLGHLRTPLHIAFGSLFIKSWDAREEAEAQLGRTIPPPKLITLLKQMRAKMPKKAKSKSPVPQHQGQQHTPSPVYTPEYTVSPQPHPQQQQQQQQQHPQQPHQHHPSPPATLPRPPPQQPPTTAAPPLYTNNDMFHGIPTMPMNPRYPGGYPDMNFGGEMDWNYLMNEYSDIMMTQQQQQPPHQASFAAQHQQQPMMVGQDPSQATGMWS